MAIAGLVLGIVGIVFRFIPGVSFIGLIAAIVGLIISILARNREPERRGMATAGLILSIIAIVIWLIVLIACGALFGAAFSLIRSQM